jgi:ADP-ribose pyrophosphatase YjhB (NUDIX family)
MVSAPVRLRTRTIARYPYLELREHDVSYPGGERVVVTVELCDWCVVAARDESGLWILVEQHRHGVNAVTLEPAGGIVDRGETPEQAALRELVEETGYVAHEAEPLGWVHPNPALSANRAHLFLVRRARRVRAPEQSVDENTSVVLLTDSDLSAALESGRISHALGVVGLERALRGAATASRSPA